MWNGWGSLNKDGPWIRGLLVPRVKLKQLCKGWMTDCQGQWGTGDQRPGLCFLSPVLSLSDSNVTLEREGSSQNIEIEFLVDSTGRGSELIKNTSTAFIVYLILQAGSCKQSYHLLNGS